jgi:hypothetical protein
LLAETQLTKREMPKLLYNAKIAEMLKLPKLPKLLKLLKQLIPNFNTIYINILYSFDKFQHNCINKLNLVKLNKKKKQKEILEYFLEKN